MGALLIDNPGLSLTYNLTLALRHLFFFACGVFPFFQHRYSPAQKYTLWTRDKKENKECNREKMTFEDLLEKVYI